MLDRKVKVPGEVSLVHEKRHAEGDTKAEEGGGESGTLGGVGRAHHKPVFE